MKGWTVNNPQVQKIDVRPLSIKVMGIEHQKQEGKQLILPN
jgi:hypothetical protein